MIVTHTNPDMDAITGVWLLKRYCPGQFDDPVQFVNTANPDADLLALARAVVDTGKEYDPNRLRFDHHQLPGNQSTATCAAQQVYYYLYGRLGLPVDHLEPLVDLVFAGDTGGKTSHAEASRELGLHALLSGYQASCIEASGKPASDQEVLNWMFTLLDLLDTRLRNRAKAKQELAEKVVYRSGDGRLITIRHGSQACTFAAQEEGAVLVVFQAEPIMDGETALSYPVGVIRAGEWTEPHVGKLVEAVCEECDQEGAVGTFNELSSWYKHPAGFFCGRGTGKAVDARPVHVDLAAVAASIDKAWER